MKTIALYGLQMLVGLVALAAGYAKLTGMGFVAEPLAMIGLGKTFLILAGTAAAVLCPVGEGNVLLFALNPMWRMQTHGSYQLLFNAAMNYKRLR